MVFKRLAWGSMRSVSVSFLLALVFLSGCGDSDPGSLRLQGAGASFPAPLYARWFQEYSRATPGVRVDYQAKGSGAGIKDFINQTVDFAASDAGMEPEEMEQVERGVVLLPLTAGQIVLAYNLPEGPRELKLSREAYSRIMLGEITRWDDPLISASNLGQKMPALDITVVVRSDSSGTNYVFSSHLQAISQPWASSLGVGKKINWPSSHRFIKGPKNDGVMALIRQTPGSIGYVEYGFASQTGQPMASLENRAGQYVRPTAESGLAALASSPEIPDDLQLWLPDPQGELVYPIVTYSWLVCYRRYSDARKSTAIKSLVRYCLTEGQKVSRDLGYIPLPDGMVQRVEQVLELIE